MERTRPTINHAPTQTLCFRLPNGVIWTVVTGQLVPFEILRSFSDRGMRSAETHAFDFNRMPTAVQLSERIQLL